MMTVDSQTEEEKVISFDLLPGTSESARAKTAETFLELLGARVRNPNTRRAYRVAWRSFLAFCSARQLELGKVKAYHVGSWLDQHPGSRSTQRQHLAAVRAARAGCGFRRNEGENTSCRSIQRRERQLIFGWRPAVCVQTLRRLCSPRLQKTGTD